MLIESRGNIQVSNKSIAATVTDEYKTLFAAEAERRGISQAALMRELLPSPEALKDGSYLPYKDDTLDISRVPDYMVVNNVSWDNEAYEEHITIDQLLAQCEKHGGLVEAIARAELINPNVKQCMIHAARRLARLIYPTQEHKNKVLKYIEFSANMMPDYYLGEYPEAQVDVKDRKKEDTLSSLYFTILNRPLLQGTRINKDWDYFGIDTSVEDARVKVIERCILERPIPSDILAIGQQAISDGKLLTQDLYYEDGRPIWNKFMLMALIEKQYLVHYRMRADGYQNDFEEREFPRVLAKKFGIHLLPQVKEQPEPSTTRLGKRLGKAARVLNEAYRVHYEWGEGSEDMYLEFECDESNNHIKEVPYRLADTITQITGVEGKKYRVLTSNNT